ncbi:MAG: 3'-5' exonuclease [Methanomethylophilus sp.]|nr:3'-5' exonuclease [Methanomethylophilus sp.]MBR1888484.1 3'-5' exonuclease [Methanomethylophilus sp.]MEE3478274.1 3'-5' exonuclease [Methanomethylophilus sp.]
MKTNPRPGRGKSLIASPEDYVCIDLETTGLRPSSDWIIEVAAYRMRSGKAEDRFVSFVRPGEIGKVSSFITQLTGITREMVADAPLPEEVLPELFDFVGDDMVVGHNTCFDMNFLYDGAVRAGLDPIGNDFTDTMRISRRTYKELPNHRLGTLAQHLDVVPTAAHRAAADVETTIRCYEQMVKARRADIPLWD